AVNLALLDGGGGIRSMPKAALRCALEDTVQRSAQLVQALRRQLVALMLQQLLDPRGSDLVDGQLVQWADQPLAQKSLELAAQPRAVLLHPPVEQFVEAGWSFRPNDRRWPLGPKLSTAGVRSRC